MKLSEKIAKNYSARDRRKFLFAYLLLIIPIAHLCVFYFYVNIDSFFLSFQDKFGNFTLNNFVSVWKGFTSPTGTLRIELLRSMATWAVGNFVTFPLSLIVAYVLFKKVPMHMVFRVVLYLPTMLGSIVMVKLYASMLQLDGPVMVLLKSMGFELAALKYAGFLKTMGYAFPSILAYGVWLNVGGNMVVLTGAFVRIPQEVFEAGKLDGVGFFREFFQIAIPLVYPTINTLLIFTMASIFTADFGTFIFDQTASAGTATIGYRLFYEVYQLTVASSADATSYGYPAAIGWTISVITIPLVLVWRRFLEKHLEASQY